MNRDRDFYINSIKMDLYRVVTATGDTSKPASIESAKQFLEHSLSEFDKFSPNEQDIDIKNDLQRLHRSIDELHDPRHRLRWTEDVLTARCRLY
jgi:hypothetical protein